MDDDEIVRRVVGFQPGILQTAQAARTAAAAAFTAGSYAYNSYYSPHKRVRVSEEENQITPYRKSEMPFNRRYRKQNMKNYFKRRNNLYTTRKKLGNVTFNRRQPALVQRRFLNSGNGWPKMLKMTHKWTAEYAAAAGGGLSGALFKATSLLDPGLTTTTTNALNLAAIKDLYDHYVVIGAKIRVVPHLVAGTAMTWGIMMQDDGGTSPATIEIYKQQPTTAWKFMNAGTDPKSNYISKKYSAKKVFGSGVLANNSLQGTGATDSTEDYYFNLFWQGLGGASVTPTFIIEIDYIVIWKELKDILA